VKHKQNVKSKANEGKPKAIKKSKQKSSTLQKL